MFVVSFIFFVKIVVVIFACHITSVLNGLGEIYYLLYLQTIFMVRVCLLDASICIDFVIHSSAILNYCLMYDQALFSSISQNTHFLIVRVDRCCR